VDMYVVVDDAVSIATVAAGNVDVSHMLVAVDD
jgi:hypothetical protein